MPAACAAVPARLKREDCPRTKHDALFSPWKVLVGPSDWEDHSAGKEGVQRYRVLNLPENFPGLYELGVARASDEGTRARRHGLGGVVVVYLGQADNVRARLQQYGRTGSHLDGGNSLPPAGNAEAIASAAGPGLFREVFARGYFVVFRCALMDNKQEAEKTETKLLRVFDYAWNKLQNGACRREEVLVKLEQIAAGHKPSLLSRVRHIKQKMFGERAGIKINRSGSVDISPGIIENMLPRVHTFVGFRPQLVKSGDNLGKENDIYQQNTSEGNTCGNKPARRRSEGYRVKKVDVIKQRMVSIHDSNTTCGVMLEDGSSCLESPIQGRKRCELHKGRRVSRNPKGSSCRVVIPIVDSMLPPTENERNSDQAQQTSGLPSKLLLTAAKDMADQKDSFDAKEMKSGEAPTDDGTHEPSEVTDICEAKKIDSSVGISKVMLGSKECQLHDSLKEAHFSSSGFNDLLQNEDNLHSKTGDKLHGEKTGHAESQSLEKQPPGRMWFELLKSQKSASTLSARGPGYQTRVTDDIATICGVVTDNGYCKMVPVAGTKRCEEHKGIKVTGASLVPSSGNSGWPSICGARALDGLPCKNQPIEGRKRCALHKGQRACFAPQSIENKHDAHLTSCLL